MKDTDAHLEETDQTDAPLTHGEGTAPPAGAAFGLADVPTAELDGLKYGELQKLCKAEGVNVFGKKADLVKRLKAKKLGGDSRFIPGKTICKYCGALLLVNGTAIADMSDGRMLYIRQVKCTGKRRHSYTHKEIVGKEKSSSR